MTTALRPLSLGELLDRTFTLYRRHFVVFIALVALPNLAGLTLQLVNIATGGDQASLGYQLLFMLVGMVVGLLTYAMSQAATIVAVSELHLGRLVTIAGAFRAIVDQIIGVCIASLVVGLLVMVGFLLLILPGIYLVLRFSLVVPTMVLERLDIRRSIERSGDLTRGDLGRIFVVYLLYFLLVMVFGSVVLIPAVALVLISGGDGTDPPVAFLVLTQVGGYLVSCLFGPLLTIALSLLYYDERVRKEAFDLEHLMTQADDAAGAPATPV